MYLFSFLTKKKKKWNTGITIQKIVQNGEAETVTYNIRKKTKTNKDLDYNNSPRRFRPLGLRVMSANTPRGFGSFN